MAPALSPAAAMFLQRQDPEKPFTPSALAPAFVV